MANEVIATTPPAPATPTTQPAPAKVVRVSAHERAIKVREKLDALESAGKTIPEHEKQPEPKKAVAKKPPPEPKTEPKKTEPKAEAKADRAAPASDTAEAPASGPSDHGAPDGKENDETATRRLERLDRIRKAQAKERESDQERRQSREHTQRAKAFEQERETLRKRIAELEPHAAAFKSPMDLLAAAERAGLGADTVIAALRQRAEDPSVIAQHHAQTETEKLRAELKQMQDYMVRQDQLNRERQAQAQRDHEQTSKTQRWLASAKESAEHPLTAQFQSRHGDAGLIAFANHFVAPVLPENYTLEELHDQLEQLLEEVQLSSLPQSKNGAAQPKTTLSNGVSSGRGSVAESLPLHRLPRGERVRLLKSKLGGE